MNIFPYILYYTLFLIIGNLIQYLGIFSIYYFPFYILIPFNYLAILFGIKKPLEKKDIEYRKIKFPLLFGVCLIDSIVILVWKREIISWFALLISSSIILIVMKLDREKIKEETEKNIDEYFKNKN